MKDSCTAPLAHVGVATKGGSMVTPLVNQLTLPALRHYITLAEADTMHLGLIVKGLKLHLKTRATECPELRDDLLNYQRLYDAARLRLEEATAKLKELSEEAQ